MNAWKATMMTFTGLVLMAPAFQVTADDMGVGQDNSDPDAQPTEPAQTESATGSFLQSLEAWFDPGNPAEE